MLTKDLNGYVCNLKRRMFFGDDIKWTTKKIIIDPHGVCGRDRQYFLYCIEKIMKPDSPLEIGCNETVSVLGNKYIEEYYIVTIEESEELFEMIHTYMDCRVTDIEEREVKNNE